MKKPVKVTLQKIRKIYRPADRSTHKGLQGHGVIIGGSYGKIGAVCLASKACLKSGAGLVTAFLPRCGYEIIQAAVPEIMALTDDKKKYISQVELPFVPQAIGIGPGMGQKKQTQKALHRFLETNSVPLVIDADALNILSLHKKWLSLLKPRSILTPHPKELERLVGSWSSEEEKLEMARAFSLEHNAVIVVKGAPAYIADGGVLYENTTGNAALATAGSGDVLTGIITGFLAQSYEAVDAALLGVYLHGLTADIALPETGQESFTASEILSYMGKAFLAIAAK